MQYGPASYFLTPNPTVTPTEPGWWAGRHASGLEYTCRIVRRGKRLVAICKNATYSVALDQFCWIEPTTAPWNATEYPTTAPMHPATTRRAVAR